MIETFTGTLLLPTVGIVICSDLPILVETAAVEFFTVNFVRFLVEVVVAKKVLFVATGVGVGVAEGVADGVGVAEGVGVATGVGVAVGVGVGVATGVGVGVGVGVADGVAEGVGVGVATAVGVGVGVGVGVATGVGFGVATGAGVTGSVFAPGSEIANRVVPAKNVPPSNVKVSLATSPKYSI